MDFYVDDVDLRETVLDLQERVTKALKHHEKTYSNRNGHRYVCSVCVDPYDNRLKSLTWPCPTAKALGEVE